jgi:hypothetical protein
MEAEVHTMHWLLVSNCREKDVPEESEGCQGEGEVVRLTDVPLRRDLYGRGAVVHNDTASHF